MPRERRKSQRRSGRGFEKGIDNEEEAALLATSAPMGPGHFDNEGDRARSASRINKVLLNRIRLTREVVSNTKQIAEESHKPPNYFTVKRRMYEFIGFRSKALFPSSSADVDNLWDIVQEPVKQVLREVDTFRGAIGHIEQEKGFRYASPELEQFMRGQPLLSCRPLLRMGTLYLRRMEPEQAHQPPKEVMAALFPDLLVVMDVVHVDCRRLNGDDDGTADAIDVSKGGAVTAKKREKRKKKRQSGKAGGEDGNCTIWAALDLFNARVEDETLQNSLSNSGRRQALGVQSSNGSMVEVHASFVVRGAGSSGASQLGARAVMRHALELAADDPNEQDEWTKSICRVLRRNLESQVPHGLSISGVVGSLANWVFTHLLTCGTACHAALVGNNASLGFLANHLESLDVLDEDTAAQQPLASAASVASALADSLAAAATMHHCAAVGGDSETMQLLASVESDQGKFLSVGSPFAGMHGPLSPTSSVSVLGPDGLAPVHCAVICANVPVLTTLLESYVASDDCVGSPSSSSEGPFSPALAYQGLAGPLHLLPFTLDAFQHFLVLECCGTFDLHVPGFRAHKWHTKSDHFLREYSCNVFSFQNEVQTSSGAYGDGSDMHLAARGNAAIASMVHDLVEVGLDVNEVVDGGPDLHTPTKHGGGGGSKNEVSHEPEEGNPFASPASSPRRNRESPQAETNPFARPPPNGNASAAVPIAKSSHKPDLPPLSQRIKTLSQRKRDQGNLVFGGGVQVSASSGRGKTNPEAMSGKTPLHLVCEFIGAAGPSVMTTACLAFQKRDSTMSISAGWPSPPSATQPGSPSNLSFKQFVDCIIKTMTGAVRALLNVGANPNLRTAGHPADGGGRTAAQMLLAAALDTVASVSFAMGRTRVQEANGYRDVWARGVAECVDLTLALLVRNGAQLAVPTDRTLVHRWAMAMDANGDRLWANLVHLQQAFCDGRGYDAPALDFSGASASASTTAPADSSVHASNQLLHSEAAAFQRHTSAWEAPKHTWHGNCHLKGSDACEQCGNKISRGKRHHCRHCAALVCSACGSASFPLLPQGASVLSKGRAKLAKPVRVCCCCYNTLSFQLRGFLPQMRASSAPHTPVKNSTRHAHEGPHTAPRTLRSVSGGSSRMRLLATSQHRGSARRPQLRGGVPAGHVASSAPSSSAMEHHLGQATIATTPAETRPPRRHHKTKDEILDQYRKRKLEKAELRTQVKATQNRVQQSLDGAIARQVALDGAGRAAAQLGSNASEYAQAVHQMALRKGLR
eukprot:INCI1771.1.p1 GENE.INCI1771.1~~INCI1771.1.p1  ORF type:complete len:1264 (-),score=209.38 INCI1771.1:1453-5244(-)